MKLSDRFSKALVYATELHADQRRKISGVPYVSHLLRVAGIALDHGADEDEAIAALLHDAIEDQGGGKTRQQIRRLFGDRVVEIVDGCTDTDQDPKPPWRERKEAYLARLKDAPASVRLVSASDKLDNARSILISYRQVGESLWEKFSGGRDGVVWYYRSVVEALKRLGTDPLVDELDRVVSEVETTVLQETGKHERTGKGRQSVPGKRPVKAKEGRKQEKPVKEKVPVKRKKSVRRRVAKKSS